eukprot:TRINITY_DN23092_c0_g1_i1.p1 TRINITY_DN23092_c0_g1~~TRINITY_DN23092_c0_g1_i1.p1  ORF type:complete len:269 (+),score=118.53 TRINITY_DN23092_c0_g1_i1:110-808(+)
MAPFGKGAPGECRRDPETGDGAQKKDFKDKFSGYEEWDAAPVVRKAPSGKWMTKGEFKDTYSGYREWDAADSTGGRSGGGKGKGEEMRRDRDGRMYTKTQFRDHYGGYREWDEAAGGGKGGYRGGGGGGGGGGSRGPREETIAKRRAAAAEGRRLIVGNLAWRTAWQDLKDHFKPCGEVVHADVFKEYGGRSKGVGVVEFKEADAAKQALETLNDSELGGRQVWVRPDKDTE